RLPDHHRDARPARLAAGAARGASGPPRPAACPARGSAAALARRGRTTGRGERVMSRSGSSAVRAEASWPAHRPGSGPGGGARSLGLAGADRADAVRPDTALRRLVDLVLAG